MGKVILGIIFVIAGAVLVIKAEWFLQNFGRINWAEKHLGAEGGTRLFYKLLGLAIIVIGFLTFTGLIGTVILAIFSPVLPK